jgi:hypothetical protein
VKEHGFEHVEHFNDTRMFYGQIAEVMTRAKQLATMWYARALPPPPPVAEILPSPLPQVAFQRPAYPALAYQPEQQVEVITLADMERVAVKRR